MSFLGDIFGGIVSGISAVFGIGKTIVGGVSSVLDATGIASLVTSIATITSTLGDGITSLVGGLGNILDPIKSVVHSVDTLAKTIQNEVIVPIVKPITDTVSSISALEKTIGKLVDEGIGGLVQIPKAISDALTGVEASWDRATAQLAANQSKIVSESLVPGIDKAVAPGLASMTSAFLAFSSPGKVDPDQLRAISINPEGSANLFSTLVADATKAAERGTGWDGVLLRALYDFLIFGLQVPAQFEPFIEQAREQARIGFPNTAFQPGEVLQLYTRQIMSHGDAVEELKRKGYNDARIAAILQTSIWLPAPPQVVDWLLRGIITRDAATRTLKAQGLTDDDISGLLQASLALVSPNTLLDWEARGFVDDKFVNDQLRSQGYSDAQIVALKKAGIAAPSIGVAASAVGNRLAGLDGWFTEDYLSKPPEDVLAAGRANRVSDVDVQNLWTAHFNALPVQTAINLFFRGELNRRELQIVVTQNNYPSGMVDTFIKAYSEQIASRSIPTLVVRGDITPAQGVERLIARGYTQEDANLLVDSAVRVDQAKPAPTPTDTTKLSVAQLASAYKDGVIDEDAYRALLGQHGYSGDDLDVTVALVQYDIIAADKKAEIDTLNTEVSLGIITASDAIQQLNEEGYSATEVQKAAVRFLQTQRTTTKMPDLGLLTRLAKKGFVTRADFIAGLQALGYQSPWDELIATLEVGTGETDGQPTEPS